MANVALASASPLPNRVISNSSILVLSAPAQVVICLALLLLTTASAASQEWIYTVRPGDNIWNLTEEYLADMQYWPKLQALNKVADPGHLPPGSRLRIPIGWLKRQPAPVRVIEVQGQAEAIISATGQSVAVTTGLLLRAGDAIRTDPDSNVTLEFGDGSRLLVQANSHLIMDTLSAFGETGMIDTRLRLQKGRVESWVTPRKGPDTHYQINTPAAVTAVRGTQYRVSAEQTVQMVLRTEVLSGKVAVSSRGKTRLVPAKFGTLTTAGAPPEPPVQLLPPPSTATLPKVIERVPISFNLTPLAGAVGYRLQIAPDEQFLTLLFDSTSTAPPLRGPDLADGDYVARVRGIDARGLEGIDARHRFTLNARPEPPFLVEPKPDAIVYDKPPAFQWSEPEKASSYRFQLAADERFDKPLLDISNHSKSSLLPDQPLPPGAYFWRVATRDTSSEQGPFSDPQRFKLQAAPTVGAPAVEENALVLRWGTEAAGERYQFQLAKDAGFEELLIDTTVSEPQVRIPRPASGFYYLRIRPINTAGSAPFGPVQRINVPAQSHWPLVIVTILTALLAL